MCYSYLYHDYVLLLQKMMKLVPEKKMFQHNDCYIIVICCCCSCVYLAEKHCVCLEAKMDCEFVGTHGYFHFLTLLCFLFEFCDC